MDTCPSSYNATHYAMQKENTLTKSLYLLLVGMLKQRGRTPKSNFRSVMDVMAILRFCVPPCYGVLL